MGVFLFSPHSSMDVFLLSPHSSMGVFLLSPHRSMGVFLLSPHISMGVFLLSPRSYKLFGFPVFLIGTTIITGQYETRFLKWHVKLELWPRFPNYTSADETS